MVDDDTTRRLHFGAPPAAAVQQHDAATPRAAPPQVQATTPAAGASAEEEADAALRYLEAEWTMRMEAPLSALAGLEDTLTHAIDTAARSLPFQPHEASS